MRWKSFLKNNVQTWGVIGIAGSWLTVGSGWADNPLLSLVGFAIAGLSFGLAILGIKI